MSSGAASVWIADTGHHRVLGADLDGRVHSIVGSGPAAAAPVVAALTGYDRRIFIEPIGLTLSADDRQVFVADHRSCTIWRIDAMERTVELVAGTGEPLFGALPVGTELPALGSRLPAPAALALDESAGTLYIAMDDAGQIWSLDLAARALAVLAGAGGRAHRDGPFAEAAFARPCGLALAPDRKRLYVADAGNRALRFLEFDAARVTTLLMSDSRSPARSAPGREAIAGCAAVTVSPGGLAIVDDGLGSIRGVNLRHATATPGLLPSSVGHVTPAALTFERQQRCFLVADQAQHRILCLSRDLESAADWPLYRVDA